MTHNKLEGGALAVLVSELITLYNKNINHKLEKIMDTQEEIAAQLTAQADKINALAAQVGKAKGEVIAAANAQADAIAALQAEIANAGGVSQAVSNALAAVTAATDGLSVAVQAVDDINPDVQPPVA